MFGFKNDNKVQIMLGLFLVGTNKSFKENEFENRLYHNDDYEKFRYLIYTKRKEYNITTSSFEWIIDEHIINSSIKVSKDLAARLKPIADRRLSKDYKGYGDDLRNALISALMCVRSAVDESMRDERPGTVSLVIQVPKYVTMLLDIEGKKHNSINWLIDNNSFVQSIREMFVELANKNGYKGDILTLLRWSEM